jgi:hypothetical protein
MIKSVDPFLVEAIYILNVFKNIRKQSKNSKIYDMINQKV